MPASHPSCGRKEERDGPGKLRLIGRLPGAALHKCLRQHADGFERRKPAADLSPVAFEGLR
jgi:hypothetical protein